MAERSVLSGYLLTGRRPQILQARAPFFHPPKAQTHPTQTPSKTSPAVSQVETPPEQITNTMTNIYILLVDNNKDGELMTFTKKQIAIETARYYRDVLNCVVSLRHDKQCHSGWCDIKGFIDF